MPPAVERRWSHILARTWHKLDDDRIAAVAAGAAFFVLLALFPGLAALVTLYGLFTDPITITRHLAPAAAVLPPSAFELLDEQLLRIATAGTQQLGFALAGTLAFSLWSANAGMKAMIDALNVAFGERETRGILALNATSLGFTLAGIGLLLAAMAAVVGVPILLAMAGLPPLHAELVAALRWPALLVMMAGAVALMYRLGPCRRRTRRGWISWGGALASLAWLVGSVLFSIYVARFADYNRTYGSLGAVIVFMTWLWLSITIVLAGAELDAAIAEPREHADRSPGPDVAERR